MDSWERFNQTSLPNKDFYSGLNMGDTADIDYRHAKRAFEELEMNNLGNYHNLYVQICYYLPMYLTILEIKVLKHIRLIQLIFLSTWINMTSLPKKD